MHVHILGIGGTFMGGIAAIAREAGFRVTGSDRNLYPPMSTQLAALGIEVIDGYEAGQLDLNPDVVVVGNALSRGTPVVEAMLDRGLPYVSGPEWLAEHVLRSRHVIAIAGTHGKTTTTGMLSWILESAGLAPGFLIGGVPENFTTTARLGSAPFFVIEADEYDTAFFDKRAKFVHYRPRTAVLNNLEFDHADIYPDLAAIERQFNQLLRTVPRAGRVIVNGEDPALADVLAAGCWTPRETFGIDLPGSDWAARVERGGACDRFEILRRGATVGRVEWPLIGRHNVQNALAAVAAAEHAGVAPARAIDALCAFRGIRRRMQVRGIAGGVTVYDDFAHHPTAIATTLEGLRARVGTARLVAVLEPRSNTMKLGAHRDALAAAVSAADDAWFLAPPDLGWDLREAIAPLGDRAHVAATVDELADRLVRAARPGDHWLIMSNGGFGGLHERVLRLLDSMRTAPRTRA
ncbi:MAG: UDP-N-acetylmuramate:L-alanyl-gamma-D-glutamyl-meso-diaminopimelate ligase [Gammaproteobacteria bacterium]|nr:UDP-N-acetylmuramate:L-alanyl-gamma-D-glutamyl-meso-diaminopimelate ligase [Gammaproteobacteria bacterium]